MLYLRLKARALPPNVCPVDVPLCMSNSAFCVQRCCEFTYSRRQRDRHGRTQSRTRHFHKINSQFFHSNRFLCIKLFISRDCETEFFFFSFFLFLSCSHSAHSNDADRRSISPCLCECAHGREGEGESEWNLIIWPSLNPYTLARHKFCRIYFYFNSAVLFGLVSFVCFANSSQFVGTAPFARKISTRVK